MVVQIETRQALTLVIGLYVITRMLALIGGTGDWEPGTVIRVMAVITILVTIAVITAAATGYVLSGGW
jgi:hypothetical protein